MCRTAAAVRGRRRDCTCKLCQVAQPFPIQRYLLSMRPSDSSNSTWESSPAGTHTLAHRQHRQRRSRRCAQEDEGRERRRRGRRRRAGGGASTASQETGGRVAMQMGSIHRANHWSLSALQRKSLFRQNSRIWSYVPPVLIPFTTPPDSPCSIHSPSRHSCPVKDGKKAKWECRTD